MCTKSNVCSTSGIIEKISMNIFWEAVKDTLEYGIGMIRVTCAAHLELLEKYLAIYSGKPLKIL